MREIYKNLKYIREKADLSKNKFAEKLDTNASNITRWENGDNGMSLDLAYDISEKLNIPIELLVSDKLRLEDNVKLDEKTTADIIIMDGLKEITEDDKEAVICLINGIKSKKKCKGSDSSK